MAEPQFIAETDEDLPRTLRRAKAEQAAQAAHTRDVRKATAQASISQGFGPEPASLGEAAGYSDGRANAGTPRSNEAQGSQGTSHHVTSHLDGMADAYPVAAYGDEDRVTVTRIDVPFFRLMTFFLKAVIAAIPALILLGAILFGAGQLLKMFLPWLVQTEILIRFPN